MRIFLECSKKTSCGIWFPSMHFVSLCISCVTVYLFFLYFSWELVLFLRYPLVSCLLICFSFVKLGNWWMSPEICFLSCKVFAFVSFCFFPSSFPSHFSLRVFMFSSFWEFVLLSQQSLLLFFMFVSFVLFLSTFFLEFVSVNIHYIHDFSYFSSGDDVSLCTFPFNVLSIVASKVHCSPCLRGKTEWF